MGRLPGAQRRLASFLLALGLAALGLAEGAEGVDLTLEDVDGDGESEWVLENARLRVEVMTGRAPAPAEGVAPKYGTRFVGPGWISNVVWKPGGRRWFVNDVRQGRHWHGIPEEFDEAVRMVEIDPDVWHCLKIGVGVCRGRGVCTRGTLSLVDPGAWVVEERAAEGGGRALVFAQTVTTAYGYGYRYEKTLSLMPGETRFVTARRLENTGTKPLATTWYTHAFWGQADAGNTYDDECWGSIPIRALTADEGAPPASTHPCTITNRPPGQYWGAVPGDVLGGAWYACGHRTSGDFFVSGFSRRPDFYRVWTFEDTYSCEPFLVIDLAPGEALRWTDTRGCGNGLRRVDGQDGCAAYEVEALAARPGSVRVRTVPFVSVPGRASLVVTDGSGRTQGRGLGSLVAGECVEAILEGLAPGPLRVGLRAEEIPASADGSAGGWLAPPSPGWDPMWAGQAAGRSAVVFADLKRNEAGDLVLDRASAFLADYLERGGFTTAVRQCREEWDGTDWASTDLIVLVGGAGVGGARVRRLEDFVRAGGGLLLCGPLDVRAYELSDLLPVRELVSEVVVPLAPRDCTRDFLGASRRRYHLCAAVEHPIAAGLPLFPAAYQDIARLQIVEPRDGATVVLRYGTPDGLEPRVTSPALVVGGYGRGRVAVLTCPVDWGSPPQWCLWSRLGEYHRKLLVQTALWACGRDE